VASLIVSFSRASWPFLLRKILGGDTKNAAVGAVLGSAIGTGIAAGTKGKELEIPAGTEFVLTLDEALSIG
jgi:hypothetical protein